MSVAFVCAAPTSPTPLLTTKPLGLPWLKSCVQPPLVHELVEAYNLSSHLLEGYEADDIISTLAFQAAKWVFGRHSHEVRMPFSWYVPE